MQSTREVPTCMVGSKRVVKVISSDTRGSTNLVSQYNSCIGTYSEYEDHSVSGYFVLSFIFVILAFSYLLFKFLVRITD